MDAEETITAQDTEVGKEIAQDEGDEESPPPLYKVFDKVFASDKDGLMYEAVIRRALYGPAYQKQQQIGLDDTSPEAMDALSRELGEVSSWHYFVHFLGWKVQWDRWICEDSIRPISDENRELATLIKKEHKTLQLSMVKKAKGKKMFQTVDGGAFLQLWRRKLDRIEQGQLIQVGNTEVPNEGEENIQSKRSVQSSKARQSEFTRAAIEKETQLRRKGLSRKRNSVDASSVPLPFTLKKNLVEQWEIVTQCDMVLSLPADITVKKVLAMYLHTKILEKAKTTDVQEEGPSTDSDNSVVKVEGETSTVKTLEGSAEGDEAQKKASEQKWRDMAEGLAMLFDEALPERLLFKEEMIEHEQLMSSPEYRNLRFSELYGVEHLLRLFVRLPAVLADVMPEDDLRRPLLAKVNDLVRFIHKDQTNLLSQPYRKRTRGAEVYSKKRRR